MSLNEYFQRYEDLRQQDALRDQLLQDLLKRCEYLERTSHEQIQSLQSRLEDTELDLQDATHSRRETSKQMIGLNLQFTQVNAENESLKNRNPYIMILVDGDGLIFNLQLIRQGIDGGKRAANSLRNLILEQYPDEVEDIEIIAKVCANISGLEKALRRHGAIDTIDSLRDFTVGFTQGKDSFDFIDVGPGKERADAKIRENARWHLRNHNCKHLLLGVSHDAGYAPFLDEVIKDETIRRRIAIIEGPPTVRELKQTAVRILDFDELFLAEKLTDRFPTPVLPLQSTSPPPAALNTQTQKPSIQKSAPAPTPPSSWAGLAATTSNGSSASSAPVTIPIGSSKPNTNVASTTQSKTTNGTTWNPGHRGLDEPIRVDAAVLESVRTRKGNDKLCKEEYLRGPCLYDNCPFEHSYSPSKQEILAIRFVTRLNPCTLGQECMNDYCIYGHHCPTTVNGVCTQLGCRYAKEDHPPGTIIKNGRGKGWGGYGDA